MIIVWKNDNFFFKKKTRHVWVGSKNMSANICNNMEMEDIVSVDNFIYLGLTIDNNLNLETFINSTIRRLQGHLARIRKLLDVKASLLIYKQTTLPVIDYVSVIVNSSTQRKIAHLQPLQNRANRTIRKLNGYI